MTDAIDVAIAPAQLESANRRTREDRRGDAELGRRAARVPSWKLWFGRAMRDASIVVGTIAAIVFSLRHVHPIFSDQPSVVAGLTRAVPGARVALTPPALPKDTGRLAELVASPRFETDRKAFAADLMKTGRMTQGRADSIAYYAVREAYVNGIPPAIVFGVMLTENAKFVSGALSDVGAVGLMQVYPKIWLKALRDRFGSDLATDSTNLKYGIYILKQYVKSDSGKVTKQDLSKGLLRYNGCVRGTNTPNCQTYPGKVKTYVEKQGMSICADQTFYDCIAKPFIAGLFGRSESH